MDSVEAMVLESMSKDRAAGPPVICSTHVQGLGGWAWVRQPVMGHIVPIRQLRATAGDSRNIARLRLVFLPGSSSPLRNSTTSVLFPTR